jgi:ribonucleoside-diphosphate reductase alpha chain
MQFDTTANRWHTCPNTARINASNPCVTGDTLVATTDGWQRIDSLVGGFAQIYGADGQPHFVDRIFPTGTKQVFRLRTKAGYELCLTADHKVLTANRGDVPASQLAAGDRVVLQGAGFGRRVLGERLALAIGVAVGDGCLARTRVDTNPQEIITLVMAEEESAILEKIAGEVNEQKFALKGPGSIGRNDGVSVRYGAQPGATRVSFSSQPVVNLFKEFSVLGEGSDRKRFTPAIYELDKPSLAGVLRGLFTADGTVANYGEKSQYIALDSTSLELLQQTQLLLLSFGIKAKIYRERLNGITEAILPDGRGGSANYSVKEMHSLRVSRSSRFIFEREIGFDALSPKAEALAEMNRAFGAYKDTLSDSIDSVEPLGEEAVYDLTEPVTSHFSANGLVVHNCSEFFFLDDTACNLASLNLMRFRTPDREFDIEEFKHAVRITITAQEIMVGNAAYPTDKITVNSFDYRPLGLGYANLGALLMARGLAYDSDEGRAYAAAITAILSGEAYHQSAKMAGRVGAFAGYERNKQPMLRVIEMHRDHVEAIQRDLVPDSLIAEARTSWDNALEAGRENGYRNSQISVLAPTGTIGFLMDCDTTGVEPDIAIVKYKSLVGGGMFKIVNQTVPEALERLGYSASERKAILEYIEANDTIEGAPGLAEEHLSVFDCAFRAKNGTRTIHYLGHIKMMSAVQPFISGAISKTVNMPHDAVPEEIAEAYLQAWKLGIKALAIYRDGSKKTQPLSTGKAGDTDKKAAPATAAPAETRPLRRKLPDERQSLTHKFSVGGHEGYITIGLYPDQTPGEIFITMSKEGSVVSGLMDSFATSISLALQYGVPLRTLVEKFMHTRFEPSGFTGNPDIPMAKSIMDYLFRYVALKFLDKDERAHVGLIADQQDEYDNEGTAAPAKPAATAPAAVSAGAGQAGPAGAPSAGGESRANAAERQVFVTQADAPPCPECGSITSRNGACYRCNNCGTSIGCS